jgi:hypothetical protein
VGAIKLVSPANKDRPAHRDGFTAKCQTCLQQGIGLMIVDVVTTLSGNLHNELMQRLELPIEPMQAELYAIAYRVAEVHERPHLEIWQESFTVWQSASNAAALSQRRALSADQFGGNLPLHLHSTTDS